MATEELTIPKDDGLVLLFNTDPLKLNDKDLKTQCDVLRRTRKEWGAEEKAAKAAGRRPKAPLVKVDLKDLGLGG